MLVILSLDLSNKFDLSFVTYVGRNNLCLFFVLLYSKEKEKQKRGDKHSILVAEASSINKKLRFTNRSNFLYSSQIYNFEATNHKLNPAFKENIFYEYYT